MALWQPFHSKQWLWFIQNSAVTDFALTEAEHMYTYTQICLIQTLWWILFQQLTWASCVKACKYTPDLPFKKDICKRKTSSASVYRQQIPVHSHFNNSAWTEDCCESMYLATIVCNLAVFFYLLSLPFPSSHLQWNSVGPTSLVKTKQWGGLLGLFWLEEDTCFHVCDCKFVCDSQTRPSKQEGPCEGCRKCELV